MKVIGYVRVSTNGQADEGLGLEVQEQAIHRWARRDIRQNGERDSSTTARDGHRVVSVYADEGISGSNGLDTRFGLAAALEDLRDGKAKGLVVYRLDRLARDLVLQEQLIADIRRIGAELFSTSKSETESLIDDPDDPSRKMIRQVLGAVSEYERSMIRLRLRSGRRRKADNGGFAYGSPPYGYRSQDRELVPDDDEQATLERIAVLHRQGLSLRLMAKQLTDEGLHPKRSDKWHPESLRRIVARH